MEANIPLADQFAGLRASPTTPNADTRILSTALHALIAAIFARIFARLEQFLLLWQAGTLPVTPARPITQPSHRGESRPPISAPDRPRRRRIARQRPQAGTPPCTSAARSQWPSAKPAAAAPAAITPSSRPRSARAPPRYARKPRRQPSNRTSLLFRYQNK